MNQGIAQFKRMMADFRSVGGITVKAALATPLVIAAVGLGPPSSLPLATVAAVAEAIVLMTIFQFWRGFSRKRMNLRMTLLLVMLCVFGTAYWVGVERYTLVSPKKERIVFGYEVRGDVSPLLSSNYTVIKALSQAQYRSTEVWTRESVSNIRCVLEFLWLASFVALASFIGAFVLTNRMPTSQ
jgi:hypothetical protein